MKVINRDVKDADGRRVILASKGYWVNSWAAGPVREGAPKTRVHLTLDVEDDKRVILELESPERLDELVGMLLQHRKDVWP